MDRSDVPEELTERAPCVLVAEDQEDLRILVAEILEAEGFSVVSTPTGDAALGVLSAGDEVDLLLTDIMMPGSLDGWHLARAAKSLRPELRIIYMTGFATLPPDGYGPGYGPVLPKPWRPKQLVDAVHRVMRTARPV
jgi:CheY-like chemotaxis protein